MRISIHTGSILDVAADAIVNPANSHLRHGGGLAHIIARAAEDFGREIVPVTQPHGLHTANEAAAIEALRDEWRREQDAHPLVPTGGAGVTSAGALPYEGIIHAVGPVWGGGTYFESRLLSLAHFSAIEEARERGWSSIVFPAISCGIFGYPVERAAPVAVASAALAGVDMDITFALMEDAHVRAYTDALKSLRL